MENINLIPLSSALIVGTLLFSYLNISSDSHIKIKLKCLGEKKFIFFLIIFVEEYKAESGDKNVFTLELDSMEDVEKLPQDRG